MPKTLSLPPNVRNELGFLPSSGVEITWTPSADRIDISGWYDGFVHIQGGSMNLREFFDALGIKMHHCKVVFKENNR